MRHSKGYINLTLNVTFVTFNNIKLLKCPKIRASESCIKRTLKCNQNVTLKRIGQRGQKKKAVRPFNMFIFKKRGRGQ